MMKIINPQNRRIILFLLLGFIMLSCQFVAEIADQIAPNSTAQLQENTLTSQATQLPGISTPQSRENTLTAESTPIPSTSTPAPTPTETLVPIDKEFQLEIFQALWETVDQEYLYPDYNGLDWEATYDQYRQQIEDGLATNEFYLAMNEMIFELGDEHSAYLDPRQVQMEQAEFLTGHDYVGIGAIVQYLPEKQRAVILLTFPAGPADKGGLLSHDRILAVEGISLEMDDGASLDLLLGVEGTPTTLTVQTPGEEPRTVTLLRERIVGSLPVPYELLQTPSGKLIGYILIPSFADTTIGTQVGSALTDLSSNYTLDGIILDNRINSGGYGNVLSDTLSYFTSGTVGYFVNRTEREALRISQRSIGGSADLPLVVLVGPETISFGEIFSGILKDQGRATLIGETTEGNVEILWGYNFKDGSRAWIAHDTFKPVNHPEWDWEQDGVIVDIEAPADWDEFTFQTDPAIQAALEHLDQ